MTCSYLLGRPLQGYAVTVQIEPRLSPGDGLKGLLSSPIWF
jgi:hypothetical protein